MSAQLTPSQRFNAWLESVILTRLVPLDTPGPLFRWAFKLPIFFFKTGLHRLVPKHVLLLTHTGRKSGLPRHTPLEFTCEPDTDSYLIMAGWGGKTDWLRNVIANPEVRVQVGKRKFEAVAEPLPHREVAEFMLGISKQAPVMKKVWERWAGRPLGETLTDYLAAAPKFPMFRLVKH
ncbi:MAG: nitroreductase family deazaflavin-dependent oxidoreductase [Chloroflexota bacterium]